MLRKEKEYLISPPSMDVLTAYIRQPKQYKVPKESMIRYQGHKYSVPTRYIGCRVTTSEIDDSSCTLWGQPGSIQPASSLHICGQFTGSFASLFVAISSSSSS